MQKIKETFGMTCLRAKVSVRYKYGSDFGRWLLDDKPPTNSLIFKNDGSRQCYQIQDEFLIAIVAAQRCEIITKFLHYCETKIEKGWASSQFLYVFNSSTGEKPATALVVMCHYLLG